MSPAPSTPADLLRELDKTDRRTRALIDDLGDAQLAVPYHRGINPPVWELGHSAFFYEYFLLRQLGGAEPRMPGYDEIWDSFEIQHRNRWQEGVVPPKTETLDYYQRVLDEVRGRLSAPSLSPYEAYLTTYVIFHQNMHIESMVWSRQTLGYPVPQGVTPPAPTPDAHHQKKDTFDDVTIPGGTYPIGMPPGPGDDPGVPFSFDNERPGFEVELAPFAIARKLVSNRDFLAFVEAGGYRDPAAWSYGGRWWLGEEKPEHPAHWRHTGDGGAWETRFFDRWIELPLDAPTLHISFWEAEAFANWAGRRLPSEYEWEAAARGPEANLFPWGGAMEEGRADLDVTAMGLAPTSAFPEGASWAGCIQMLGTAWEWTTDQYLPYDGFKVDIYPYMSTLQFGDHKTTRGGSCATSACLIRSSYRQAFLPGRRDVYTGFRTCPREGR